LAYYFLENNFEHFRALFQYNMSSGKVFTILLPLYLMFLVSFSYVSAVSYSYFLLYEQKGGKQFQLPELMSVSFASLSKLLIANTIFSLLVIIGIALLAAFVGVLGGVWLSFLFLPLGIFGIIYGIRISLYTLIILKEKVSLFTALKRSIELIKGHWWETFGIFFVLGIVSMLISQLISTLFATFGLEMFKAENILNNTFSFSMTLMVGYVLSQFLTSVFTSIFSAGGVWVQYTSLVASKEGVGLQNQVDKLGKTPDNEKEEEDF